jgi:hypothetical protein
LWGKMDCRNEYKVVFFFLFWNYFTCFVGFHMNALPHNMFEIKLLFWF